MKKDKDNDKEKSTMKMTINDKFIRDLRPIATNLKARTPMTITMTVQTSVTMTMMTITKPLTMTMTMTMKMIMKMKMKMTMTMTMTMTMMIMIMAMKTTETMMMTMMDKLIRAITKRVVLFQELKTHWPKIEVVLCESCGRETFCSHACRQGYWDKHHRYICPGKHKFTLKNSDWSDW